MHKFPLSWLRLLIDYRYDIENCFSLVMFFMLH